ncbi:ankryin, partial [Xanthomonas citri pv. citri]|nr:ankryin [Xanthomonas citri pv. citri]
DVNRAHAFGGTRALHLAAEMGHVSVIRSLCEAGADANARKVNGGTPLHTSADSGQRAAVEALVRAPCNADLHLLLNNDTTPLYL